MASGQDLSQSILHVHGRFAVVWLPKWTSRWTDPYPAGEMQQASRSYCHSCSKQPVWFKLKTQNCGPGGGRLFGFKFNILGLGDGSARPPSNLKPFRSIVLLGIARKGLQPNIMARTARSRVLHCLLFPPVAEEPGSPPPEHESC